MLVPGEIITAVELPALPFAARSHYLKVRDRASYAFALASAAVALDMEGGTIKEARIALGGVGTKPWRAFEAEKALAGKAPTDENFRCRRRSRPEGREGAQGQRVQGRTGEAHTGALPRDGQPDG